MKEKISFKLLNGLVIVGIALTIITLIATPLILKALLKISNVESTVSNLEWVLAGCIYICSVPYLIALFKLKSICGLLCTEEFFSPKIAKEFQVISICAFVEAILFTFIQLFLYFCCNLFLHSLTLIPSIIIPFVAVTAGFLSFVMAEIFRKAAQIKEDIDLTF